MKLNFFNNDLNDLSKNGSFTICSRELSFAAQELGVYANPREADHIIYMDAFEVDRKIEGKSVIPYVVSEYNFAPTFLIEKLIKNNTFCLAISDQARNSFISAGLPENQIATVHLGARTKSWPNLNQRNRKFGGDPLIYITNNSSNNRSGYDSLIPAWIEFAKGKNVKLIIKDQYNPRLAAIINQIDLEKKIIYDGRNLPYEKLVFLYNSAHVNLYINSCTSFGLTILEGALTGLPSIVSRSAAIPEFTSEEFVTYVDCDEIPVDNLLLASYRSWGLVNNLLPLENFKGKLIAPRPRHSSILAALENSYKNYEVLVSKNQKFVKNIENNFTWQNSVKKIINILKDR